MPELADISPLKKEKIKDVDIMVIRELTGGIYFGKHERVQDGNSAIDISQYSKFEIIRIANMAFELALHRNKKVFSVDKANVLETSRLWRETVNDIATKFPEVSVTHMFIDNAAMQLIKRPSEFDVLLTENMFGDILTDEASMIAGSIGLLPSASIGDKYALYEPIHGSYNKAAGLYVANPIGTILSAAMMLRMSFKMKKEAEIIEKAIHQTLKKGFRTRDICGINTKKNHLTNSKEFTAYVIQGILDSNPS
jgi:3-isopropylmalate dehydrogenase